MKISEKSFLEIWNEANKIFNLKNNYYWYPLIEKPIIDTIIVYKTSELIESNYKQILEKEIGELFQYFYVQLEFPFDGSRYHLIKSKEFDIDLYSEKYLIANDCSGILYFSHEDTISFSGGLLVKKIKELNINLKRIDDYE